MPSTDGRVDLRSDTVTTPTPEMRIAMARAPVGDDVYREDPTVNRLEELAADVLGKEAAIYTATGTMANQLAIHTLTRPGTEILSPARAHVYRYEAAAVASNAGVQVRPLADEHGVVSPHAIASALEESRHHFPPISLVTIENTHMPASGRPVPASEVADVAWAAAAHALPLHCDGARVFNAAAALGTTVHALAAPTDTIMFCVSKGLGAPVGSLLCGRTAVIDEARAQRQRFGGAWRQAGMLAAAAIMAIEEMSKRLPEDHQRAHRLAVALSDRFPGSVDPDAVRTNIVCARMDRLPTTFLAVLDSRGIRAGTIDLETVRLVTHKDIDDDDVDRTIAAFDALALEAVEARRARLPAEE
ncbi:MAG: threonine aldolase family protein [Acidimicrobiia bacterium]